MIAERTRIADWGGVRNCGEYIVLPKWIVQEDGTKIRNSERLAIAPRSHLWPVPLLDHSEAGVRAWGLASMQALREQMNNLRYGRGDPQWLAWHIMFAVPPGDNITAEQLADRVAEQIKKVMGENTPFLLGVHCDEEHLHAHVLALGVNLRGKVFNPHMDFRIWEMCSEEMEIEGKLFRVKNRKACEREETVRSPLLQADVNKSIRTGEQTDKVAMRYALEEAKELPTFAERLKYLAGLGIEVRFNVSETGRVAGWSLARGGLIAKGGGLGRQYTWGRYMEPIVTEKDRAVITELAKGQPKAEPVAEETEQKSVEQKTPNENDYNDHNNDHNDRQAREAISPRGQDLEAIPARSDPKPEALERLRPALGRDSIRRKRGDRKREQDRVREQPQAQQPTQPTRDQDRGPQGYGR